MPPSEPTPPSALTHALDQSGGSNSNQNTTTAGEDDALSPLEQEVLDEYARLLGNLNNVRISFPSFSLSVPSHFCFAWKPNGLLFCSVFLAVGAAGPPSGESVAGDSGFVAGVGAQDEPGVYAAQGERVQHTAAGADWG